jgi:hypothetical protein
MRHVTALGLALLLLGHSAASWAGSEAQESTLSQIGTGVGSGLGTVVYFPFKAVFCLGGGIASGFTLIFAGRDNADRVAGAACRGTWAITSDIINGKEPVKFVGDPS